ncbi:MAG TPA: hypothetical protein VIN10_13880 [Bacteroidales bacterium]
MKTKILFLACLLGATVMMLSCQKDADLTPELSVEQSMDVSENANPDLMFSTEDPGYDLDILSHYPDPFYTRTKIKFIIRKTCHASLSVTNMETGIGEKLFSGNVNKGVYFKLYDAANKPAGRYLAVLNIDGRLYKEIMTKKSKWDPAPVGDPIE